MNPLSSGRVREGFGTGGLYMIMTGDEQAYEGKSGVGPPVSQL